MNEMFASLNLDYKKWKFDSQDVLTDFVSAGFSSENRFDQLFSGNFVLNFKLMSSIFF